MQTLSFLSNPEFKNAWEVFLLFLIPIGGGIPAGVVLAQSRGLTWPVMIVLYFLSDIVLACMFEPLMRLMALAGRRFDVLARFHLALKLSVQKSTARYGVNPGPLTLILISFGVDPMTGRAAALLAGHGFVMGWTFAIIGDLFFFSVIMASTLWLNSLLGDGTWTAIIIMAGMLLGPSLFRRLRERLFGKKSL